MESEFQLGTVVCISLNIANKPKYSLNVPKFWASYKKIICSNWIDTCSNNFSRIELFHFRLELSQKKNGLILSQLIAKMHPASYTECNLLMSNVTLCEWMVVFVWKLAFLEFFMLFARLMLVEMWQLFSLFFSIKKRKTIFWKHHENQISLHSPFRGINETFLHHESRFWEKRNKQNCSYNYTGLTAKVDTGNI